MNKYPNGKLNEDDKGELLVLIGEEKGNVVVKFGKSVEWFALPSDDAIEFALLIIKQAKEIGITKPITIEL